MPTRKMRVVPPPEPRIRVILEPERAPVVTGVGAVTYLCGGCEQPLLEQVAKGEIYGTPVLKCPACGAYNEF